MRIIDKMHKKIKQLLTASWIDELMWFFIIIFVGLGAFSLGAFYERRAQLIANPVTISYDESAVALWQEYQSIKNDNLTFFASKNGSVVYPVGCKKGDRIKEENKVFFQTVDQAVDNGYREVEGC